MPPRCSRAFACGASRFTIAGMPSSAPDVGRVIAGRYRIDAPIGAGGFGAVWRCTNTTDGSIVALKMLHVIHTHREVEVKRFQREAALVTRLDHPNVVKTLDYGHDDEGAPFIVFELLAGAALKDTIKSEGALAPARATAILRQVLAALEHAHGFGIVHRDIKPANIFLCAGGEPDFVRVLDFGIAKALLPEDQNLTKLTNTGSIIGTPHYMAPEQIRGDAIGPTVDLYALGLVLAEVLTGRRVVQATTEIDVMMWHMDPGPIAFSDAVRASPFFEVIRRATEKAPAARFQSAADMRAALDLAAQGAVSLSRPIPASIPQPIAPVAAPSAPPVQAPPPPSNTGKIVAIVAAAALVAIGGGAAGAYFVLRNATPAAAPTSAPSAAPIDDGDPTIAKLDADIVQQRILEAGFTITQRLDSPIEAGQGTIHSYFLGGQAGAGVYFYDYKSAAVARIARANFVDSENRTAVGHGGSHLLAVAFQQKDRLVAKKLFEAIAR
jgi:eukaryotic-like serine/threonine-protein kinase